MPELELGDLTSPTGRAVTIFRVAAVMAWPEPQEPEEREARERCFAEIAASVRRHRETGQALSEIWNHTDRKEYIATRALTWLLAGWSRERGGSLKEDYKRSGGEARVAEAPRWSKQVADCDEYEVRWTVTAAMMMELRKLDAADAAGAIPGVAEPVSVNKAAYLVTKLLPTFDNEHHIEEIWRRYRPVAHLCAALMTWGGESYEELDRNFQRHLFDHTAFLIAGAKLYEDWLVGRFGEESKKDGEGRFRCKSRM